MWGHQIDEKPQLLISTAELRAAFDAVITNIEQRSGTTMHVSEDFFWWLDRAATYDVMKEPSLSALTIGQLSEAWAFLTASVQGDCLVPQAAVWLAQVLRAIGDEAAK